MKEKILLLVGMLVCLHVANCLSQNTIHIIPQAGLTIASTTINSKEVEPWEVDMKYKLAISAGLVIEYALNNKINLQVGVSYTQRGQKADHYHKYEDLWETFDKSNFQLNYLDLPLMVRTRIFENLKPKFYIKAGAVPSYFIDGKMSMLQDWHHFDTGLGEYTEHWELHNDIEYSKGRTGVKVSGKFFLPNRWDVGIYAGVGVQLIDLFRIELGFTQGIIPTPLWGNVEVLSQMMQLQLYFPIQISGGGTLKK